MVSVTAFVDRKLFTRPITGVGVLIPATEQRKCLGILFSSSAFAGRVTDESRWASFTVMMGGSLAPQWVQASDDEINRAVQTELHELLGISGESLETVINRWPRAIPQCSVKQVWRARKPGAPRAGCSSGLHRSGESARHDRKRSALR